MSEQGSGESLARFALRTNARWAQLAALVPVHHLGEFLELQAALEDDYRDTLRRLLAVTERSYMFGVADAVSAACREFDRPIPPRVLELRAARDAVAGELGIGDVMTPTRIADLFAPASAPVLADVSDRL